MLNHQINIILKKKNKKNINLLILMKNNKSIINVIIIIVKIKKNYTNRYIKHKHIYI